MEKGEIVLPDCDKLQHHFYSRNSLITKSYSGFKSHWIVYENKQALFRRTTMWDCANYLSDVPSKEQYRSFMTIHSQI